MDEKDLIKLEILLEEIKTLGDRPQLKSLNKKFILEALFLTERIKKEASQTPAGTRWFNGQLEINKTINQISLFKNTQKGFKQLYSINQHLLKELHNIIKSGKNRYI